MLNQLPTEQVMSQPHEVNGEVDYVRRLGEGMERAKAAGFDLDRAIVSDGRVPAEAAGPKERSLQVLEKTADIARDLALDESFFEQTANTVLLTAIASEWLAADHTFGSGADTEGRTNNYRAALVDAAMALAGEASGTVRDLAATDDTVKNHYIIEEVGAAYADAIEFWDSINDAELAADVKAVLAADGPGSFLAAQRKALGAAAADDNFDVKVLKVGDSYDLRNAGLLPAIKFAIPPSADADEAELQRYQVEDEAALAQLAEQVELTAPYEANAKEYEQRFAQKIGKLRPAFVFHHADGRETLYLRARTAYALLNYVRDRKPIPQDSRYFVEGELAYVQHEYKHTQKMFLRGARGQLGMVLEERGAELLSGDRHGYTDIKDFVDDLGGVSGVSITDELMVAVAQPDALSALTVSLANKMGLRDMLVLMTSHPTAYDTDPEIARYMIDLSSLRQADDAGVFDAVVRSAIERKGDEALRRASANWAASALGRGMGIDALRQNIDLRRGRGLTHSTAYREQALEALVGQRR